MLCIGICFLTIGWYAYVLKIIENTDLPLIVKIIMYLGGAIFGVFNCISLGNFFDSDK